jgi:cytochrome c-type biogenesis protein CcmH
MIWYLAVMLTLFACAAVLWPLLWPATAPVSGAAYDLEVYKDQLAALEGDLARGAISAETYEQARAEIARKALQADARTRNDGAGTQSISATGQKTAFAVAAILVPALAWAAYSVLGRPDLPAAPLAARISTPPADADLAKLVAQAERHLAGNASDGRGWDVLAPVYMRMERFDDAANAFRNAIRLNGSTPERQNGLGEALTIAARGIVSAEAEAAFKAALAHEPGEPVARFYLATAKGQQGRKDEALRDFESLAKDAPAGAPWLALVEDAIARLGGAPAATAANPEAPGPSQADMEAAAGMDAGARMEMIEGMVAQLSEKLRENPADMAGWQRLIRSYTVLGKSDEARAALSRAVDAFSGDAAKRAAIVDFARALNVEMQAGAGG